MKVCFLFDGKNNWIEKSIRESFKNNSKTKFFFTKTLSKVSNFDIVFILGYTKKIDVKILSKNRLNLLVHESNLPKGRGFAPVQWQILQNNKRIPITLLSAEKKLDSGKIYLKDSFNLKGYELYDEIRFMQSMATIKIIKKFIKNKNKIKPKLQKGKATYFKRRSKIHQELNMNKSIKENFNLLRISNNNKWPAYFYYKNKKYILKIFNG